MTPFPRAEMNTLITTTWKSRLTPKEQIAGLIATLKRSDPDTWAHSLRVKQFALLLGEALGFDYRAQRRLRLGALLHDIGKLKVPQQVLQKPGRLTDVERIVINAHAALGEAMLTNLVGNRTILHAIRGHHERFSGGGYPDGLEGQQIPLLARILAIADCFDAMTTSRPYRKALSRTEAIARLRQGAGTQFDPTLVLVFVNAMTRPQARPASSAGSKRTQYFPQVLSWDFHHGEARTSPICVSSAADVLM